LQAIAEDIGAHKQPLLALIYQAEQIRENSKDVLSPNEINQLNTLSSDLKNRLDNVSDSHKLLKCFIIES
jgi:hypothetical protein